MAARKPRPPTTTTETIRVTVPKAVHGGGVITMRQFTTRDLFAVLGELPDAPLIRLTFDAVVEWLPGKDPLDARPSVWPIVLNAWMAAKEDEVFPPANA